MRGEGSHRYHLPSDRVGPPTPAQLRLAHAYAETGTLADAAACVGVSPSWAKTQMSDLYRRLGVGNNIGAFRALGYLRLTGASQTPSYVACGWTGVCSRPRDHRGQHGGFRQP